MTEEKQFDDHILYCQAAWYKENDDEDRLKCMRWLQEWRRQLLLNLKNIQGKEPEMFYDKCEESFYISEMSSTYLNSALPGFPQSEYIPYGMIKFTMSIKK